MNWKWSLSCSTSLMALALAMGPVYGQSTQSDDSDSTLETVVVTGIRASVEKALENKRDSTQVIESIVAEDIGKLPDNNVVEALQRVTGVQVTDRSGGEVSTIYIRGLSDITTTWNGRNMFTSSDRYFSVQDMPATLVSKVDVYKTRAADQIETGIAGQINVTTHRPFDFDGLQVSAALRGTYRETRGSFDPNANILVSNRWHTSYGDFGALVDLSFTQARYRTESDSAGALIPFLTEDVPDGWVPGERVYNTDSRASEDQIWAPGLNAGLDSSEGATFTINGEDVEYVLSRDAIFMTDYVGNRERPSANVALQWAPNDWSVYTFEFLFDSYRENNRDRMFFSYVDWWYSVPNTQSDYTSYPYTAEEIASNYTTYAGTNIVRTKNLNTVYNFTSGDVTSVHTNSYVYALNGEWNVSNRFNVTADLSYQASNWDDKFVAMRLDRWSDAMWVDFNRGDGVTEFGYDDNSLLYDTSDWATNYFYDNHYRNEGSAKTVAIDAAYDLKGVGGILGLTQLKFGVRYDDRNAAESQSEQSACNYVVTASDLSSDWFETNSKFFKGVADVAHKWVVVSGEYLLNHTDYVRSLEGLSKLDLTELFSVDEATYNAYAMVDFSKDIFDHTLSGQLGVRYVKVKTGMTFEGDSADALVDAVLPNLTLRYEPSEDVMLRFNYGETLRRPDFTDLDPNYSLEDDVTSIGYGTGSAGNPYLKPTRARNYDITAEWYFMPGSALYASGFLRKIDGLVVTTKNYITKDFDGYNNVANYNADKWVITEPMNGSDGTLKGAEFGAVIMPQGLPGYFDGLGFQGSLTYITGSQKVPETDDEGTITSWDKTPFAGVSNWSYNLTMVYEHGPVGMRLSYVWRNKFYISDESASFANPIQFWRRAESSLDLQASYQLYENAMLTFDAVNLLDSWIQSYYAFGSAGGPDTDNYGTTIVGRTFSIGLRYSLN